MIVTFPYAVHTCNGKGGPGDKKNAPPKFSMLSKVINGTIAGLIGVVSVFPLDLVKTRMQTQQMTDGKMQYTSIADCFRKIYRNEGPLGFYKGVHVAALMASPEKALKLFANDFYRNLLSGGKKLSLFREIVAGSMAGVTQTIITTPAELLKIQFQDSGRGMSPGDKVAAPKLSMVDMVKREVSEKGVTVLYRGGGATIFRDVVFSAVYFPMFFNLRAMGPSRKDYPDEAVFWWTLMSGIVCGAISALVATPADVVKTRVQLLKTVQEGGRDYGSYSDAVRRIFVEEGWRAFFKGGACRMMVLAPLYGISQVVYYLGVGEYITGERRR